MLVLAMAAVPAFAANQAPVANAGPDQTVSVGANCIATVSLDGSASTDPDGDTLTYTWTGGFTGGTATGVMPMVTFPAGVFTVTLTVDDGHGATATASVAITANDTTPPVISSVTATPAVLWPPNHKMHHVTIAATATDNCNAAPVCKIISVTDNEDTTTPQKGNGNGNGNGKGNGNGNKGNASVDFVITGDLTVDLRAEREGQDKAGRTYTITIQCTDAAGNSATSTTTVLVPHDQRGHNKKNAPGAF